MQKRKPIYSMREQESALEGEISEFVVGLAEFVDTLQDLHSSADFGTLARRSGELSEHAHALGYPMFAEAARLVVRGCETDEPETAEQALIEMAELARRIREAHRGAA
jgi:hypothetical protein